MLWHLSNMVMMVMINQNQAELHMYLEQASYTQHLPDSKS